MRAETAEGLYGWGECYTQSDRDTQVAAHLAQMERYLVGRESRHIKHFTEVMFNDYAARRGAMDCYAAVSGIEQALWDIAGKRAGLPVYDLLGGACRDRIKVYANGWANHESKETVAASAKAVVERGFRAIKFDPNPGPWRSYISSELEDEAVARVRAVREAVGPDVEILIEMHRRLAPVHAIRLAKRFEEFRPFWYEEPVLASNLDALARVKDKVSLPVVTGEALYTKFAFREVFEKVAADIINPDVCNVGGILELKEIAAMAEAYFVSVSPHNYNSTTVGLAATMQASTTMPNFLITEYFVNFDEWCRGIVDAPFEVKDGGYIDLPTKPGLGIDIDEEALERYPWEQFPARHMRSAGEEGS